MQGALGANVDVLASCDRIVLDEDEGVDPGKLRVARKQLAGELTLHGVTRPVVLDVAVNKVGTHPMRGTPAAGFDATTTIRRSDFGIAKYVPNVSDEIAISISTETFVPKSTDGAGK